MASQPASLAPSAPLVAPTVRARPRAVSIWLFTVAAMVFAMVVVGGITRLTDSGLSMVTWEPISGIVPPLNEAQWQAELAAYRATTEYQMVNRGMSLDEFKGIFFWEYVHRVLGRLIGLAFAVPLAVFAVRRWIPEGYRLRLAGLLALGGLQGAIGWWMVASGLVGRVDVAHERLAVHLTMALVIMSALLWTAFDMRREADWVEGRVGPIAAPRPTGWVVPFLALLLVQIVFGAFVAGLKAGWYVNSWPLMDGHVVHPEVWRALGASALALVNDPITVQAIHRKLAIAVAVAALWIAWRIERAGGHAQARLLAGSVAAQFLLGVLTLLNQVPLGLGVLHQAGAAVLLGATVWAAHWCHRPDWRSRQSFGLA